MNFNYEYYLQEAINKCKNDLGLENKIYVSEEQVFAKERNLKEDTIYVVVKYLTSSITYGVKTQPIQLMILSEQNSLDNAKAIFGKFAQDYNLLAYQTNSILLKQQYNEPVVVSNFQEVSYGYRSLIYLSGVLNIMENIIDIEVLHIDNVEIKPLSFAITYSMSGNTQPVGGERIASTEKSMSTFGITLEMPFVSEINGLDYSVFVRKILNIIKGSDDSTGNENFSVTFNMLDIEFEYQLKLVNAQITTAPEQAPSLNISFMK